MNSAARRAASSEPQNQAEQQNSRNKENGIKRRTWTTIHSATGCLYALPCSPMSFSHRTCCRQRSHADADEAPAMRAGGMAMSTASSCTLSRLSLSPAIFRYLPLSPAISRYLPGRCFHGNRGCALGSSFKVESVHMRRQESATTRKCTRRSPPIGSAL